MRNSFESEFIVDLLLTAWKRSKYGVFSGPYFPVFGLNTEIYAINLEQQKNSVIWHFYDQLLMISAPII